MPAAQDLQSLPVSIQAPQPVRVGVLLPRPMILRAIHSFAARRMLDVVALTAPAELESLLPQVVIADARLPNPAFRQLVEQVARLARLEPPPRVVLYCAKEENSEMRARAAALGAKLV